MPKRRRALPFRCSFLKPKKRGDMKFAHAKPAWVYPQRLDEWPSGDPADWDLNCEWRPGLWIGTAEKGPRRGWHYGVWWDKEGKQHAFHLPPDYVDLQPKPPTLAKPQRTP